MSSGINEQIRNIIQSFLSKASNSPHKDYELCVQHINSITSRHLEHRILL